MLGRKPKVPQPVRVMLAVLDDLWLPYGLSRDTGLDPDRALDAALGTLFLDPQLNDIMAFLRGDLDDSYRLSADQGGLSFRRDTVGQAELIYAKLRLLPDWPTESH